MERVLNFQKNTRLMLKNSFVCQVYCYQKKNKQLGMPYGTANNKLRKLILFKLLKESNQNICFQCEEEIKEAEDLSIEHKIPWLDSENPTELFFSLDNISFSHLLCNIGNARRTVRSVHGVRNKYDSGCRCSECTEAHKIAIQEWRKRKNERVAQR